jgi:hypothetical protein
MSLLSGKNLYVSFSSTQVAASDISHAQPSPHCTSVPVLASTLIACVLNLISLDHELISGIQTLDFLQSR